MSLDELLTDFERAVRRVERNYFHMQPDHDKLAEARAAIANCFSEADRRLAEVTAKVREIHEVMKRGNATPDHGLIGNLACILDHACSKYDPRPL